MLEQGIGINAQAHNGWTALMFAAWVGKQDTVSALLASGADPGIKTKHGDTARSLLIHGGQRRIGSLLR
ncbi:ankyrin-like protein [Thiorhodovibrio litoralis]|uniref:ankyrin repeat domain-containing protein n=1 Tax=Thiorhodovibrio litoralis TaxID=2952932 RepID=UPI001911AB08|nr:ankyrin-like protein [Thiorhodovibrio litoralis]